WTQARYPEGDVMALLDSLRTLLALQPWQERSIDTFDTTTPLATQLAALHGQPRPWRLPSITEALGVPAIQRAVTLIANTTGSLALVGYRYGAKEETPRLVVRPDPYSTPRDFYRDAAYCLATRGETIFWIASRDSDGLAASLIVVPPAELKVEENVNNRMFPTYTWGKIVSTRYSTANPEGQFVHVTYLREPMALRGSGPLQLAGAAASVSVESQEWAANFYAAGGFPSIELHSELDMEAEESEALKLQWISTPSNMPKVTTGPITTKEIGANPQGAQMLEAREYQNGDAARMFGIPGSLLEYSSPGSSLTYQNLEGEYTKFVRTCLAPNYLEPIEQALTDLLPRPWVIRFSVEGLLRADIKTRYDVYKTGIESGVLTVEAAQEKEGIIPGDVENAPVPAAPPLAIPAPLEKRSGEVRCEGMRLLRGRLTSCNKLLAEAGPFIGTCPRCGREYTAPAPAVATRTLLPVQRPVARRKADEPAVVEREDDRIDRLASIVGVMAGAVTQLATREQPAPAPTQVTIAEGAVQVHNAPPVVNVSTPIESGAVQVHMAEQHPPDVNVTIERGAVETTVNTPEMRMIHADTMTMDSTELAGAVAAEMEKLGANVEEMLNRPVERMVERDPDGRPVRVVERKLKVVS
ncbi:MAG: phage portal protein, partial [Deltaproteobacteria bacterium]